MSQGAVGQWPSGPRTLGCWTWDPAFSVQAPLRDRPTQGGFRVIPAPLLPGSCEVGAGCLWLSLRPVRAQLQGSLGKGELRGALPL